MVKRCRAEEHSGQSAGCYTTLARNDSHWQHCETGKGERNETMNKEAIIWYNGQAGVATVSVTSGQHVTQTETTGWMICLMTLHRMRHYMLLMEC